MASNPENRHVAWVHYGLTHLETDDVVQSRWHSAAASSIRAQGEGDLHGGRCGADEGRENMWNEDMRRTKLNSYADLFLWCLIMSYDERV